MLTVEQKEEIKQKKRDLDSYNWHKKQIDRCELKYSEALSAMAGLRGTSYDGVPGGEHYSSGAMANTWYKAVDNKEYWAHKLVWHKELVADLDRRLQKLDEYNREIIEDKFIRRYSYEKMAMKYNYSVIQMKRKVDRILLNF